MTLHIAIVKIEEEKISLEKAKKFIASKKMEQNLFLLEKLEMKMVEMKLQL